MAWRWLAGKGGERCSGVREYLVISTKEDRRAGSASGETPKQRLERLKNQSGQLKFPGGTNRGMPDETPVYTAMREFLEETSLTLLTLRRTPVLETIVSSTHTKHFFIADPEDWSGELRTEIQIESEDGRPDEILFPPVWKSADVLLREIFPGHRVALTLAEGFLNRRLDIARGGHVGDRHR